MEQTNVTDSNRIAFFQQVYAVSTYSQKELLDIQEYRDKKILAVDSCGSHYEKMFPEVTITKFEHVQTVKEYQLPQGYFNKLYNKIENIKEKTNVLLLDHCPTIFKYKTEIELADILSIIIKNTDADLCLVRIDTVTLADNRLVDRFKNLSLIIPENYVINYFMYNQKELSFKLTKKQNYATSIY
jgi:hypothetical protein